MGPYHHHIYFKVWPHGWRMLSCYVKSEHHFMSSTNCCFGFGYRVFVKLYVCNRTHNEGENPRVGLLRKKARFLVIIVTLLSF